MKVISQLFAPHHGGETADTISEMGGSFFLPGNDSLAMGKCGDEGAAARREGKNMGWGSSSSLEVVEELDATGNEE